MYKLLKNDMKVMKKVKKEQKEEGYESEEDEEKESDCEKSVSEDDLPEGELMEL